MPRDDHDRGDLSALLSILRRRAHVVLLGVLLTVAAAYVFTSAQDERYTAETTLQSRQVLLDLQVTGQPLQVPSDDARQIETNVRLIERPSVLTRAAELLGRPYTAEAVDDDTDVEAEGETSLITITGEAATPTGAARVADALATAFVTSQRAAVLEQLDTAIREVRRRLRETSGGSDIRRLQRAEIRSNLDRLQLLRSVATGNARIVDRASVPTKPSSPKTVRDLVIGGVLGVLVGLALALVAEQLDRRLRRPEELQRALGVPLLAAVPRSRSLRRGPRGGKAGALELEAFRRLRANLRYHGNDEDVRTLLVTSAGAGSGKTTVAVYLAASAAAAGLRVLLLEADLRRPRIAELLDVEAETDLGTVLEQQRGEGADAVQLVPSVSAGTGLDGGSREFEVLPAGAARADASELLDSDAMRGLLRSAAESFDLVIIDGPPPSVVSDAVPLMRQVDGVVVVARIGGETPDALGDLRAYLEELDIRTLGAVATFARRRTNPYLASVS